MRFVGEWPAANVSSAAFTQGLTSAEMAFLAHVHNPVSGHVNHFVLLSGYDNRTERFAVRDPGYDQSSCAYICTKSMAQPFQYRV
jgi:hypothetical protein